MIRLVLLLRTHVRCESDFPKVYIKPNVFDIKNHVKIKLYNTIYIIDPLRLFRYVYTRSYNNTRTYTSLITQYKDIKKEKCLVLHPNSTYYLNFNILECRGRFFK